jgi:2-dehydro-3-deoxyphosphooctonate aldolase (KDO 8-P synthase)
VPREIDIGRDRGAAVRVGGEAPLLVIAGPCVVEDADLVLRTAERLAEVCRSLELGFVFKSSYLKDNRTSARASVGPGIDAGLETLARVRREIGVPVLSDVHERSEIAAAAEVLDVLQIPAFLCRQTDLVVAAAKTGRAINIKKGQFLAPWDMKNVAAKCHQAGNDNVLLCERGASFGYNTLVSDMRALPILAETGYPVVFDATHSVQQPGGQGTSSGGQREFVPVLARAAVAVGVAAVFMETHQDPDHAPSDGPNMVPLKHLRRVLETLLALDRIAKSRPIENVSP